ncbi:hypothetical protein QZQ06_19770 [Serratia marcescens]|uniref:hypothetical protein n=1 Tax=Serratia marcescens TaxID=615 RepID=UPI0018D7F9E7|nr:hypothetical protein [Serratia marcescens]MBH3230503.1 hypothetical protein [Serratia marcescens]MDP8651949.1 hypothetical protein [Serratia marcescens]MDP8666801.1 hypothetical protein [Serratia marcescens]MDP8740903.1 hypothetical protein [Serratia marcescens]MDP8815418.1 hypothetical protein [Serratia marcescens]
MDNKLSELKDALEFLETTEFDGEWDSALVGGENGKNYHAVINANDVVVRADDDSRHTSWLCDYLEAVSPVNIRALQAELEAKDKRIAELEVIRTDASQVFKEIGNELGCNPDNESIMMAIDELKNEALVHRHRAYAAENKLTELRAKLATPVRLPNKNDDEFWFDGVFQVAKFDRAVERAIRAAGFTVEGDE